MDIYLLENTDTGAWTIVSSVGTILAAIAAIVYTCITSKLLKETSRAAKATANAASASAAAAKATADAALQNAVANELSVYLNLKQDLTTDLFDLVTLHCRLNTIVVTNMITGGADYLVENNQLKIRQSILTAKVLNNIEDLSIFYEKGILKLSTIDAGYGYSILNIGNNIVIREILSRESEIGLQAYSGFRKLYDEIWSLLDDKEKTKFIPLS